MTNKLYFFLFCIICAACSVNKKQDQETLQVNPMPAPMNVNSGEPFLFTGKDSTVYLSWVEKRDGNASLKFSRLRNNEWSAPIVIASGDSWFVNWADYPMIVSSGEKLMAHFLDKSGQSTYAYDVKLTTSDDEGKTWTRPALLNDDKKEAEHGFVTMLPYGENFFVTWLDGRNTVMEGMEDMKGHDGHHGSMSLRAAVIDSNGKKISEWELDNRTCDCCQTSAAITSNGPVVIYRDRTEDEIRDMSIVRLINGQWTKPVAIYNDNWKIAGCPVNGPRVSSLGNSIAAAWFSAASDTSRVNVNFSSDGGAAFGKCFRIDEGSPIGRVDIEMWDEDSAVVSWMEGTVIKAMKVYSDGRKEASFVVASTSESRSSGFPQMTRQGNQLIFAWTDDKEKNIKIAGIFL